jgi:hypothetical protein
MHPFFGGSRLSPDRKLERFPDESEVEQHEGDPCCEVKRTADRVSG